LQAVIAANANCVLVMINGGLISIDELKDQAPAIIEATQQAAKSKARTRVIFLIASTPSLICTYGGVRADEVPESVCPPLIHVSHS